MNAVHDFAESLAASHRASDLPIWEEIYRKSFPEFLAMADHRQDGEHQRGREPAHTGGRHARKVALCGHDTNPRAGTPRALRQPAPCASPIVRNRPCRLSSRPVTTSKGHGERKARRPQTAPRKRTREIGRAHV